MCSISLETQAPVLNRSRKSGQAARMVRGPLPTTNVGSKGRVFRPALGQRRVGNGELLLALSVGDGPDAKRGTQLVGRHHERKRSRSGSRRGLRKSRRSGGVEGDLPFDLLHQLVNVAIEYCHRPEALERG